MDGVLQLRLIVPPDRVEAVLTHLTDSPGVVHIVREVGTAIRPDGTEVSCDVAREAANEIVEWLQDLGIDRDGAIRIDPIDVVISVAATAAEAASPGEAADALVWEQVEARAHDESILSVSYLIFMSIAAMIAAVGILLDSPILVIGAMVVGPDYGPLAAICVAIVRHRRDDGITAARTVAVGLGVAALAALGGTLVLRLLDMAPDEYDITERVLTSFISRPDGMAAFVAVLAGVVGMLALTEGRSGALIGVLVSVTTIPAVGNIGAAAAYRAWSEVGGAALQLTINVAGLLLAGCATLWVQARQTTRRHRPTAPAIVEG